MTYRKLKKYCSTLVLAPVSLTLFLAGMAVAESYFLKVGVMDIPPHTFANPTEKYMWGFAKCTDATFANCTSVQVPGPVLTATAGQPLSITVMNSLDELYQEPVSLVIPGQIKPMTPVWMIPPAKRLGKSFAGAQTATGSRPTPADPTNQNDPAYRYRVRSFDAEAPVGSSQTYTWPSMREGTYLYQSGTHPSLQIQLGLYGALIVYPDAGHVFGAPGNAYAVTTPVTATQTTRAAMHYDTEAVLLFSEIDPEMHEFIDRGHYGPSPPVINPQEWMTSTANYKPVYFLINGQAFSPNSMPIPAGTMGQTVLLRFLNAGLATKVPTIQDTSNLIMSPPTPVATILNQTQVNLPYMTILAEDGYPVPWLKQQTSVMLPAGKTMDALISTTSSVSTGAAGANIAIYDRRENLTNAPLIPGGQLAYLHLGPAPIVNVYPSALDFDKVHLNYPTQKDVTIKNNGMSALIVSNAAPAGTNAAEFRTATNANLSSIPPGNSVTITVYFRPVVAGAKSATLHIVTNDKNNPTIDIPLYGTGI